MEHSSVTAGSARRWTAAWLGLAAALAIHVVDEAAAGFLDFWNPLVLSLRDRLPLLPLPTFRFGVWLGGLILGVAVLLALARYVSRGAAWMVPVAYVLSIMMCGNGLLHITASMVEGRLIPGVYSSPVLLIASVFLFVTTGRFRKSRRPATT